MKSKICNKCRKRKKMEMFSVDRYRADGHRRVCKPCAAEYTRVYRANKHLERYTSQADPVYHDFAVKNQLFVPGWEDAEVVLTC